jgi:hypothetical protein
MPGLVPGIFVLVGEIFRQQGLDPWKFHVSHAVYDSSNHRDIEVAECLSNFAMILHLW